MNNEHLILILQLLLFYVLHSFFLHPPVKQYLIKKLSLNLKTYRISYNIFSIVAFILIYLYSNKIDEVVWYNSVILKISGLIFILSGVIIVYISFKNYDLREFIGLKAESETTMQNTLVIKGFHQIVRHPVYLGTLLIFAGYFIKTPSYTSAIIAITSFVYLQIGIILEERKLIAKFGESYIRYKSKVPKLFPVLFRKNK